MRNAKARQTPAGDILSIEIDDGRLITHCECLGVRQERDPLSGKSSATINLKLLLPLPAVIDPRQICKVSSPPGYASHPGDWQPIEACLPGAQFVTLRRKGGGSIVMANNISAHPN